MSWTMSKCLKWMCERQCGSVENMVLYFHSMSLPKNTFEELKAFEFKSQNWILFELLNEETVHCTLWDCESKYIKMHADNQIYVDCKTKSVSGTIGIIEIHSIIWFYTDDENGWNMQTQNQRAGSCLTNINDTHRHYSVNRMVENFHARKSKTRPIKGATPTYYKPRCFCMHLNEIGPTCLLEWKWIHSPHYK